MGGYRSTPLPFLLFGMTSSSRPFLAPRVMRLSLLLPLPIPFPLFPVSEQYKRTGYWLLGVGHLDLPEVCCGFTLRTIIIIITLLWTNSFALGSSRSRLLRDMSRQKR